MSFNIYQASVPAFLQTLGALSGILTKAATYAETKKIDPSVLINARLAPDMFPLARQIQIATDHAKGASARLAGVEIPSYPDTETTFAELQARIAKTVDFVKSLKPAQFEGGDTREVALKVGGQEMKFAGRDVSFALRLPEPLFPRRHRLQHPAPQRRRSRQARLHRHRLSFSRSSRDAAPTGLRRARRHGQGETLMKTQI